MAVWFVTGASRGLGAEIVRQALDRGERVLAAARDPRPIARAFPHAGRDLLAVAVDVTDDAAVRAAVDAAVERFGRIDVVVNNAGRGLLGAVEEVSDAQARAVFDTNVFGVLTVCRAVLPVLRRQRSGHVMNISSVGGFAASAGWGVYNATKFAVEGLSEAMRAELQPLGVRVTIVEPGYLRTDFLRGRGLAEPPRAIDDYAATAGRARAGAAAADGEQPGDPARVAKVLIDLAHVPDPPVRLQLGADCVSRVEAKLEQVAAELKVWRGISMSTDRVAVS